MTGYNKNYEKRMFEIVQEIDQNKIPQTRDGNQFRFYTSDC